MFATDGKRTVEYHDTQGLPMARLSLLRAGQIVRNFDIDSEVIRIGRLTDVEITLESATVSREHAVIRRSGDRYILEDSGSVNGVLVGGERVTSHTLSPGDSISIEDYVIVFEPSDDMFPSGGESKKPASEPTGGGDPSMTYLNIARFIPPADDD